MVYVNKVLHLGHEKDVSCVKQGSEMSNHCLRQKDRKFIIITNLSNLIGYYEPC